MRKHPDLILLHAPSVYDFRKKSIMFGPTSDLVPSTPIFEMYPIGFLTISNYLEKRGFSVRIINLAYRMFYDPGFDVENFIAKLSPVAFGIDLHWLPHCQGATEVAKIVKKLHPKTPVIFGGFSASYFHRELIEFDCVDFIVRGDSAEEPLSRLMSELKQHPGTGYKNKVKWQEWHEKDYKNIPNIVWKKQKKPVVNPLGCISGDLKEIDFDYRIMFNEVLRYRDLRSVLPFCDWFRYPITTIPVVRGCSNNCANCGGSKYAFELFGQRTEPAFRDPEKLVAEIKNIRKYIDSPVFLLGDLNSNGRDYVEEFFRQAKKLDKGIQIFFEFFKPPGRWFFDLAADTFPEVCYEISPDSHDEKIRNVMGKSYTNSQVIQNIEYALSKGALRFDLYFMTGLPFQTRDSILQTVTFCEDLYERLGWDSRFAPFISPMAPFMDPASRMFEDPEQFGYRLLCRTLQEHIEAVTQPSWKYILNYESDFISADDLVLSTYEAALGLNRLKGKSGYINEKTAFENEQRIKKAVEIMKEIDDIMLVKDASRREEKLMELKDKTYIYSLSTVCEKKELEFPFSSRNFKWFEIIKAMFCKK
ncbi:MAG: TIGR04190 family B12-binding domain/radical SAM domain protein [Actinobacteria bacterium]|nr:TIGR04190 family B12-binding domain/radical SAM domain protein [Actinomycetota bacterium]